MRHQIGDTLGERIQFNRFYGRLHKGVRHDNLLKIKVRGSPRAFLDCPSRPVGKGYGLALVVGRIVSLGEPCSLRAVPARTSPVLLKL